MTSLLLWGPAIAWMAALFIAAALPDVQVPRQVNDKTMHYGAYAVLGVLVYRALAGGLPGRPTLRVIAWTIAIALLHGVATETVQHFVPGRQADSRDLIADGIGAMTAVIVCGAWHIIGSSTSQRPNPRSQR